MAEKAFNEVRDSIVERLRDSVQRASIFRRPVGYINVASDSQFDEQGIFFGASSRQEIDFSGGPLTPEVILDQAHATVHSTDFNVRPPVTRMLVPTPVGNYVAMFDGRVNDAIDSKNVPLHPAESAIGRLIVAQVQAQIDSTYNLVPKAEESALLN